MAEALNKGNGRRVQADSGSEKVTASDSGQLDVEHVRAVDTSTVSQAQIGEAAVCVDVVLENFGDCGANLFAGDSDGNQLGDNDVRHFPLLQ